MKIPDKELVKRIIKQKLKECGVIRSQEKLGKIVGNELKEVDSSFSITPERTRRIALEIPDIEIKVKTRKSDVERPEKCPVCDDELKALYAKNLDNKKTEVGFRCEKCSYHGDIEEFMPMRYEFKKTKG